MALPSLATIFDFDIPQTNIVISEEETHSSSFTVYEKTIPKTLNVHDFIRFFETSNLKKAFPVKNDRLHLTPYLSVFSPPPEA